ncbi:MAG: branched-chain amino acid aminotransferase [Deltaproteobacteria bacterium]|nr:branched-chain amino acid aminotransferase [Deltaproteobacteria bacterium]
MKKKFVYLNGLLVSKKDAVVSVFDRGFLYGDGVFETVRIYNGIPFMLDEHMERLIAGLKTLRFQKLPAGIKVHASRVIETNKVTNGILRIAVTRGEVVTGIDPLACMEPTVVIAATEGTPYPEESYVKGFRAVIANIKKDRNSPLCRVKSANFLTHILAKGEAADANVDEALMLNYEGFLTEATVSNLFLLKGNTLLTPSVESGILPGVTRRAVIELSREMGLKVEEVEIRHEELFEANEAFLTNSLLEVMPLIEVDRQAISNGLPGKITAGLHKKYIDLVKK